MAVEAAEIALIEETLGHRFSRRDELEEAFTHRSLQHKTGSRGNRSVVSYERLEFLGDRVLGLIVAEMLWRSFPRDTEGALARRLADLVRKETLAAIAAELDLARFIRLPATEDPAARQNPSLLADVCEAVIAALYLDGGLDVAAAFVRRNWSPRMERAVAPPKDPKTALQEWAQGRALPLPNYTLVGTEGPDHLPSFTVSVSVGEHEPASATGPSKRIAESSAAASLLNRLTGTATE